MSDEKVKMKEAYQCPARGCDHPPFKTPQVLRSRIRNMHPDFLEEKGSAREVPIAEEGFAIPLKRLG
jgi:hypothetical protein